MRAWSGFLRVHATLIHQLDAELDADHGLPLTSYDVLAVLQDAPERRMRMRELAESIVLSRSGLTRLVDRLVRDGLIERASCPSDARGFFAVLTHDGEQALERARPVHHAGVRRLFLERFSDDELERMGGAWGRLLAD